MAGGRILRGCLLAVTVSAGLMGGDVDVSQANPVQLASYSPADDFVALSLKNSSAISATVRQDVLSTRYDIVSKPIGPIVLTPSIKSTPAGSDLIQAYTSQAACLTGGMFDSCPGFMELLQSKQQAWPRFAGVPTPAAKARNVVVASLSENVSLATEDITAPVDQLSRRTGEVIMGAASTYNPYDVGDNDAGGAETASGELYDPIAWTAAIQIGLRGTFAGVRYGRLYKPTFALVELNGKRAIVKVNDVGPLRPGRVIDLSTQSMHYFDSSLRRGVLNGVLVTPLVGANWTPGPLGTTPAVSVASN